MEIPKNKMNKNTALKCPNVSLTKIQKNILLFQKGCKRGAKIPKNYFFISKGCQMGVKRVSKFQKN
jgi:hypothetical protein